MSDSKAIRGGVSQAGDYTLDQRLSAENGAELFAASLASGERALVKIIPESIPRADDTLATWQRARHLRHPHLVHIFDAGRTEINGQMHVYAAFEYPDEKLASAIESGPLSEDDTREVLDAALDAVRYLHVQGLVHGAIAPDRILAIGNSIKLATDSLRESDDLDGHAEDVRQLGELVRALRSPEPIDEPLRTVLERATASDLRDRWTLAEIARTLQAWPARAVEIPEPPVVVPPAVEEPPLPPVERLSPAPSEPVVAQPESAAAAATQVALEPEIGYRSGRTMPFGFPKWIFVGAAAVLLLILGFNIRKKPSAASPASAPAPAIEHVTPPAASHPGVPEPLPASGPAQQEASRELKPSPLEARTVSTSGKTMWRVIAFTYGSQDAAAKKVRQVNERWPTLRAAVFAPKGQHGYYLVALGGRMTRDDALRLQRKARGSGLPRDTYIQNYEN